MSAIVRNHVSSTERKYHETDSAYVLPNDAIEQDRLDAQAAAITEMIGGQPFRAPLGDQKDVAKAVDVGCGTGIATLQIASVFPNAQVHGMDISPVPASTKSLAPTNVSWTVGNILNVKATDKEDHTAVREIFAPGSLNYIFGRMLFLGVNDWKTYFEVVGDSLHSGGLVEHQDLDWKFYRAQTDECLSDKWEWHKHVMEANSGKSGLSNFAGSGAESHMKAAGLEIVSVQRFEFSFMPSDKTPNSIRMGNYVQEKLMPHYPELLRKMLGEQGLPQADLERFQKDCVRDLSSESGVHQKYTVTIARKP